MAELVAPIVPDAQKNLAPQLLLEGLRGGLGFMAQMAQQRRQAESDAARLALQERLAGQEHDLAARKMAQEYELRDRTLAVAEEMLPLQKEASEAQTQLNKAHAEAYTEGTATATQMRAEAVKQKNALLKEIADDAKEMKLDDPHFQTKNPMEFAKNVLEFGRRYHLSPLPEVRQWIKSYQAIADSQKLFIKHGIEDETGGIKGTGNGREVPAWRIISNVNNPETREQTLRDLEASGYTELVQGFQTFTDNGKQVQVPTKTRVLKAPIKNMLEESRALETPESLTPTDGAPATPPAPAPMPDYGPEPEKPKYPIGTRGKRGDKWFELTEDGWKPVE